MAEIKQLQERERNAATYAKHPALLRQLELETLAALARNANARRSVVVESIPHFN